MKAYIFRMIDGDYAGLVFADSEAGIFWAIDKHVDPYLCEFTEASDEDLSDISFCSMVVNSGEEKDFEPEYIEEDFEPKDIEEDISFCAHLKKPVIWSRFARTPLF